MRGRVWLGWCEDTGGRAERNGEDVTGVTGDGPDPGRVTDLAGLARELDLLRGRAARGTGKKRVSIADLGGLVDQPRSTVHTYVAGKALPAADVLDRLVIALGASRDEQAAWGEAWFRVAAEQHARRRAPAEPAAPLPRQLPSDTADFVGRQDQLAALDDLLTAPRPAASTAVVISAIAGTAGVGKTALAVHWAHRVADRFPDGQLYLNLRGYDVEEPVRPEDALGRLLRALGVDVRDVPAQRDERADRLRTELAGKRMLLVLDNARSADQVRDLLPGCRDCVVVITSRDALTGLVVRDGARRLDLDLMPVADSVALLRQLVGERVAAEPDAAAELAAACARLPLALRIAAEQLRGRPDGTLAELVADLRDERHRLELLDAGGDARTAVRAVLSRSYEALAPEPARLFRLLGAHPGVDFEARSAAALAGTDVVTATRTIGDLERAHLVGRTKPGRYAMHDLLRSYAVEVSRQGGDDTTAALLRLLDFYGYAASLAMDTLYPSERDRRPRPAAPCGPVPPLRDPADARGWLDAERANLLSAVTLTEARGWTERTGRLAATLWRDLDVGGHNTEALAMHHLALSAAEATGDRSAAATALRNLSTAYRNVGRYGESLEFAQRCRTLCRESGDDRGEAAALNSVAIVLGLLGRFGEAIDGYQDSLRLRRRIGDRRGEGAVRLNLAVTCMRAEIVEGVEGNLTTALDLFVEVGDRPGQAHALNNLGQFHREGGRHGSALQHHTRALAIYRDCGIREGVGDAINGIALDLAASGRYAAAVRWHQQALAAAEGGGQGLLIDAHNSLGTTLRHLGRGAEARAQHESARALALDAGDPVEHARALAGKAETRCDDGDVAAARQLWEQALRLLAELGTPAADRIRARLEETRRDELTGVRAPGR